MTMEKPPANSCPARVGHRRNNYFFLNVPEEVKRHGPGAMESSVLRRTITCTEYPVVLVHFS